MRLPLLALVTSTSLLFAGCESDSQAPTKEISRSAFAESPPLTPREDLIAVGEPAPNFQAADQNGNPMVLDQVLRTRNVVLIFYPGDDTPGCTKQLCAVRDDWSAFQKRNAIVLGVNPAGVTSHAAFASKYSFPFPVLSDQGGHIADAYGARGNNPEKPQRTVYVIGRDGKVALSERGMVSHEKIFAALDG